MLKAVAEPGGARRKPSNFWSKIREKEHNSQIRTRDWPTRIHRRRRRNSFEAANAKFLYFIMKLDAGQRGERKIRAFKEREYESSSLGCVCVCFVFNHFCCPQCRLDQRRRRENSLAGLNFGRRILSNDDNANCNKLKLTSMPKDDEN